MTSEQKKLVEDNLALVHHIMKQIPYVQESYDDYYQWGVYGLCLAASRYDETRGEFSTYAGTYIDGHIRRHYREFEVGLIKPPRDVLYNEDRTGLPEYIYTDGLKYDDDEKENFYGNNLYIQPDFQNDLAFCMDYQKILKKLPDRERELLKLRLRGVPQRDIARELNCSQAHVSRLLKNLRRKFAFI